MKKSVSASILLLVVLVLTLLSRLVRFSADMSEENVYLTVMLMNLVVFVLPGIFYTRLEYKGDYIKESNFRFVGFSGVPVVIFLFFVMVSGSVLLNYLLYHLGWLDLSTVSYVGEYAFLQGEYAGFAQVLLSGLAFGVVPAIAEEFFFRGVFMSEYKSYGAAAQILLPAIAFALVHFSAPQLPVYFFGGLILSLCAFITRSCMAAMVLHVLYNLFALFLESFVWNLIAQRSSTIFFVFLVMTIFLLFLMLALGEGERLYYNYAVSGIPAPKQKKREPGKIRPIFEALSSPLFLLCIALFIVVVLVQMGLRS